jgi:hypothetical protein
MRPLVVEFFTETYDTTQTNEIHVRTGFAHKSVPEKFEVKTKKRPFFHCIPEGGGTECGR